MYIIKLFTPTSDYCSNTEDFSDWPFTSFICKGGTSNFKGIDESTVLSFDENI